MPHAGPSNSSMSSVYSQSLLQQISDNHRSLQVIRLNSQRLNDDHIKDLCDALIRNTIVVEVQLSWNRITDEGALRIGHLLKFNKSLRVVCLDGNEIGPKGAAALASALASNNTLLTLHLRSNHVGVEGAGALAASLCHNRTITVLSLSKNSIPNGHSVLSMIHKMLRSNEKYPENRNLIAGLGDDLTSLISNMSIDMAEELILQAEEVLKTAMLCKTNGDLVGAAEAEGIFIRICTKGQAPLDPPEEIMGVADNSPDADEIRENQGLQSIKSYMGSKRQREPDRLDELNCELNLLTYSNDGDELGEEAFEQIVNEEHVVITKDTADEMPAKLDYACDHFECDDSGVETNDASAEWIGNIYASE